MNKEIIIKDEQMMADFSAEFALTLKNGDVITLTGDLGAGKTSFARALIQSVIGHDIEVPSPTFTLVQTYDFPDFPVYHFDLYRLDTAEDVLEIGWEEALAEGVVIVEWPDRAGIYLPQTRIDITIKFGNAGENSRIISINQTP